jgi:hypothetical protein
MPEAAATKWVHVGRTIDQAELELIQETVELLPSLSLHELAETLSDLLGWYTASGTRKWQACQGLLERLETEGLVRLPEKKATPARPVPQAPSVTARTDARDPVTGTLAELGRVGLRVVEGREETALWNEYVERHHYLGYRPPAGCWLRYFVESGRGVLGCVLMAGAARAIAVRDQWIGWTRAQRLSNLGWVVNNTRFLVLPWVEVAHLASHVLGQLARRVARDWEARWGYRPLLLETFVDPQHYRGTCYQASGWELLGQTTGEGLARRGKPYQSTAKLIYVRPLERRFRELLCSEGLVGRQVDA